MMKRGFTIVELLVAIALFSILVAIGVGGFANVLRTQRESAGLIAAESNASLAIEGIARDIRTGDLFCHAPDQTNPSPSCGCTVSPSNYPDPSAPAPQNDPSLGGNLPVWTCGALEYQSASGDTVDYSLQNGTLVQTLNGTPRSVSGDNVLVKYLGFTLFGNTEGDNWTPRITITLGIAASSTDTVLTNNVVNLETTVSARSIDCTSGSPPKC